MSLTLADPAGKQQLQQHLNSPSHSGVIDDVIKTPSGVQGAAAHRPPVLIRSAAGNVNRIGKLVVRNSSFKAPHEGHTPAQTNLPIADQRDQSRGNDWRADANQGQVGSMRGSGRGFRPLSSAAEHDTTPPPLTPGGQPDSPLDTVAPSGQATSRLKTAVRGRGIVPPRTRQNPETLSPARLGDQAPGNAGAQKYSRGYAGRAAPLSAGARVARLHSITEHGGVRSAPPAGGDKFSFTERRAGEISDEADARSPSFFNSSAAARANSNSGGPVAGAKGRSRIPVSAKSFGVNSNKPGPEVSSNTPDSVRSCDVKSAKFGLPLGSTGAQKKLSSCSQRSASPQYHAANSKPLAGAHRHWSATDESESISDHLESMESKVSETFVMTGDKIIKIKSIPLATSSARVVKGGRGGIVSPSLTQRGGSSGSVDGGQGEPQGRLRSPKHRPGAKGQVPAYR